MLAVTCAKALPQAWAACCAAVSTGVTRACRAAAVPVLFAIVSARAFPFLETLHCHIDDCMRADVAVGVGLGLGLAALWSAVKARRARVKLPVFPVADRIAVFCGSSLPTDGVWICVLCTLCVCVCVCVCVGMHVVYDVCLQRR